MSGGEPPWLLLFVCIIDERGEPPWLLLFVCIIDERWRASMAFVVCVYYR